MWLVKTVRGTDTRDLEIPDKCVELEIANEGRTLRAWWIRLGELVTVSCEPRAISGRVDSL